MGKEYFCSLVTLPVIINSIGYYQTREGKKVFINNFSGKHDFNCTGTYSNGVDENWHKSGMIFAGQQTTNDIVKKIIG